jgi:heat shock protein HtpX
MWKDLERSRRRSRIFVLLVAIIYFLIVWRLGRSAHWHWGVAIGMIIALGVWPILSWFIFLKGDHLILLRTQAHPVGRDDLPVLWNLLEEMQIASGLKTRPHLCVIDDDTPNAFSVALNPSEAAIVLTKGLLKRLSRDELQGVIAHEMAHLDSGDAQLISLAAVMTETIRVISGLFLYFFGSREDWEGHYKKQVLLLFLFLFGGFFLVILGPWLARLLFFACSREREYLADATAVRFTRYPEGLASALDQIGARARSTRMNSKGVAPLYIVNPLQDPFAFNWLSSHPSTEDRIKILRNMAGAGYGDYDRAFHELFSGKKPSARIKKLNDGVEVPLRSAAPIDTLAPDTPRFLQDLNRFITRSGNYLPISCPCGVNIRIPLGFAEDSIRCPHCDRDHPVGKAVGSTSSPAKKGPSLLFEKKAAGWEAFKCTCGKVLYLSPDFAGEWVTCGRCQKKIEIVSRRAGASFAQTL